MIKEWMDPDTGVEVRSTDFVNEVTIVYDGMLARSGATQVYLHCGYGDPEQWSRVSTEVMNRTPRGAWEKTIRMKESNCNFCFVDTVNNWDNNDGDNWSVYYG